jgi:hypothetical protein
MYYVRRWWPRLAVIPLIAVVLCVWWYNPMGGTDMVATLPWRQKSSARNCNSSVADNDNSAWKRTSPSTDGATTRTSGGDSRDPAEFACVWKPHEDDACLDRLPRQITTSLRNGPPLNQRRWLFLGDSTMFQLFKVSPLLEYLVVNAPIEASCPQYACRTIRARQCDTNEQFQIPRPEQWVRPNHTRAEGPVYNGLEHPFCRDCNGCDSVLLACANRKAHLPCTQLPNASNQKGGAYGGYIAVEFARDVEIQSHEYNTTQQNVARYLQRHWNTKEMMAEFGRPICVVGTGVHDMTIPNVQLPVFLENIQWYVDILSSVCEHIVWLSNTCPATEAYAQKKQYTNEWNLAVRDLLMVRDRTSFVDVFASSVDYEHRDNIHMSPDWYDLLGKMFLTVVGK